MNQNNERASNKSVSKHLLRKIIECNRFEYFLFDELSINGALS